MIAAARRCIVGYVRPIDGDTVLVDREVVGSGERLVGSDAALLRGLLFLVEQGGVHLGTPDRSGVQISGLLVV
jgi:hypothetical protein